MPPLIAFGRRWNIASDDFVFPGLIEMAVRLFWVVVAVVAILFHNPFIKCETYQWVPFLVGVIVLNIFSVALSLAMTVTSSRGSIMEVNSRKPVKTFIYIRVPIFILEFIWTVVSTLSIINIFSNPVESCTFVIIGMRVLVFLEWVLVISVMVLIFLVFNPIGGRNVERSIMVERKHWQRRFFLCKIRRDTQVRQALDEIAALFASFFVDNEFVTSDILAGLLLLVHSPHKTPPKIDCIDQHNCDNLPEWMKPPECFPIVARFMEFSLAIYGWPHYLYSNCACGAWYLLCRNLTCCCCCFCGKDKQLNEELVVVEDNCFFCHTKALVLTLDDQVDTDFVCFRNRLFEAPFVVLVDHKTEKIVISVRGSLSLMDLITDLSLNEDLLESVDVVSDPILNQDSELKKNGEVRVHRGMLRGARYIFETLREHQILEKLREKYPSYQPVICGIFGIHFTNLNCSCLGHSLGAGIASLLSLLLKQSFPDIRCYAFSPPGCVISENGIPDTESNTLSIILGDDLVPRITYQSLMVLKGEIDRELCSTNKAKYEIMIKGIFKLFFSAPWELHPRSDSNSSQRFNRLVESSEESELAANDTTFLSNGSEREQRIQLRPPGRLLHLTTTDDKVESQWVHHRYLSRIQLSPSMVSDHLPHRLRKVFQMACVEIIHEV